MTQVCTARVHATTEQTLTLALHGVLSVHEGADDILQNRARVWPDRRHEHPGDRGTGAMAVTALCTEQQSHVTGVEGPCFVASSRSTKGRVCRWELRGSECTLPCMSVYKNLYKSGKPAY